MNFSMFNTTYSSTQDTIIKLQLLKGKTKWKVHKIISNYYDEVIIRRQSGTIQFEEDPFGENVQGTGKIYHQVLFLLNFLQTKPQVLRIRIIITMVCITL